MFDAGIVSRQSYNVMSSLNIRFQLICTRARFDIEDKLSSFIDKPMLSVLIVTFYCSANTFYGE